MNQNVFGNHGSELVHSFTISNGILKLTVLELGAIIQSLEVNDLDVVLGYDALEPYIDDPHCHGAVVGRYANRIGKGRFNLNGVEYKLAINNGVNHLHGGPKGIARKIWKLNHEDSSEDQLVLECHSPDMEEGYPGNIDFRVIYQLDGAILRIIYQALSDKDTVLNITNHSYFNLDRISQDVSKS